MKKLSEIIKIDLHKKYNYNINQVIGVKDNEKYILYLDKKLIRIYRNSLKSTPLLSSYIPIENAIFYNFTIDKNILDRVDLDSFIETKVYEEAGLAETEKYIIKYKIIHKLNDEKQVLIQTVIVPESYILHNYKYILKETGYIDYISFPAFAYKTLYNEKILQEANDVFVVILFDKIFLTFYAEGELLYINTISGGLNKIYDELKELNIKDFDIDLFKKLLLKKGLKKEKYTSRENVIYHTIASEFTNRINLINEQILNVIENYGIENIDRVFITSEYGEIKGLNECFTKILDLKAFGFEFYEEYNLDRLSVDPFLFLGMLETAYAYKENNLGYNYSLFLRKPKFIYRPSGILILASLLLLVLFSIYPIVLYSKGFIFQNKSKKLKTELKRIDMQKISLLKIMSKDKKAKEKVQKNISFNEKIINHYKNFIENIYKFKFSYLPKSQELVDLTYLMNKYKIFLNSMDYKSHIYTLNIYSYKDDNLAKFINALVDNGFDISFDNITNKKEKYITQIRIKE